MQVQLGHGRGEQQQPGVIAGEIGGLGGPAGQCGCPDGCQLGRGAAGGVVVAAKPRQAFGGADLPHGLGGDRGALGGEDAGDLGDAQPAGAQADHLLPQRPGGLDRALGAGPGIGEQAHPARPQQRCHLVHAGGGVPELAGHAPGGLLVDEVGPHRLIPALRGAGGLGEELRSRPHADTSTCLGE